MSTAQGDQHLIGQGFENRCYFLGRIEIHPMMLMPEMKNTPLYRNLAVMISHSPPGRIGLFVTVLVLRTVVPGHIFAPVQYHPPPPRK